MNPDEFVVVPDGWLSRGQAFVRGDGAQMVVNGGIPGEKVRVKLTKRTPHQVFAKVLEPIGKGHPDRVEPPCDRYTPCGRCPMMHLRPEGVEKAQRGVLEAALQDVGISWKVEPVVQGGNQDVLHSLELLTGYSDQKSIRIGIAGADGRDVVPVPHCLVVTPQMRELMKVLSYQMRQLDIFPWDGRTGTIKRFRAVQVPGGEMLVVVGTARRNHVLKDFATAVGAEIPEMASMYLHQEEEDPLAEDLFLAYGKTGVEWPVSRLRLKVGPLDPFPSHPLLAARAAEEAVVALSPQKGDAVVAVGNGITLPTLLLARKAGWAMGIEANEMSVQRARENATLNQLPAEFTAAPLAEALANPRLSGLRPLLYLANERKGIDDGGMEMLQQLSPRRILLSSTNPRGLARDIAQLNGHGYDLRRILAYDVAPFTPFTENFALLVSRDLRGPDRRAPQRRTVR